MKACSWGYSGNSSTFKVYNTGSLMIMMSVNVVFDDTTIAQWEKYERVETNEPADISNQTQPEPASVTTLVSPRVNQDANPSVHKNHSACDTIVKMDEGRRTRGVKINLREMLQSACFVSTIEPRDHTKALSDEFRVQAMQEELEQFIRNYVWELVEKPVDGNIVGTKWIYKKKIDETGTVVRNKARLVAHGYSPIEGVGFEKTFAQYPDWNPPGCVLVLDAL